MVPGIFPDVSLTDRYDLFIACDVIEHTYDPQRFVQAIFDRLNPGGVVFIQSPIFRPDLGYSYSRPFVERTEDMLHPYGHTFLFSSHAISRLFVKAGFEVLQNVARWKVGHEIMLARKPY